MLCGKEWTVHMGACFSGGSLEAPAAAFCLERTPAFGLQLRRCMGQGMHSFCLVRLARTIVLCQVRDDGLGVALGPQGARLQEWLLEVHAAGVDIQAGCHVVESVDDQVQGRPESVIKDTLCFCGDPVLQGFGLEGRVESCCCCASN